MICYQVTTVSMLHTEIKSGIFSCFGKSISEEKNDGLSFPLSD